MEKKEVAREESQQQFNNRAFEMIIEYCEGSPNSIIDHVLELKEKQSIIQRQYLKRMNMLLRSSEKKVLRWKSH
jgi:hypothetical protein